MSKSYFECVQLPTWEERYLYLLIGGKVGEETFGWDRWINQELYSSSKWKSFRNKVILRDSGCDLGIEGYEIHKYAIIHHINPITKQDILLDRPCVWDLNNVITVTRRTHNGIHYGDKSLIRPIFVERTPNDQCPWRR